MAKGFGTKASPQPFKFSYRKTSTPFFREPKGIFDLRLSLGWKIGNFGRLWEFWAHSRNWSPRPPWSPGYRNSGLQKAILAITIALGHSEIVTSIPEIRKIDGDFNFEFSDFEFGFTSNGLNLLDSHQHRGNLD